MGSLAGMAARDTRAMAGIAAAAVALGVTQLLAAFVGPASDARTAVGSAVIDLTPGAVKEFVIQTFGTADKLVLSVLVLVVIAVIAAITARWRRAGRRSGVRRSSSPGSPDVRQCCHARVRRQWTSCPPSSARCAGSWCCAYSRPAGSPTNPTRVTIPEKSPTPTPPIAVGGHHWWRLDCSARAHSPALSASCCRGPGHR